MMGEMGFLPLSAVPFSRTPPPPYNQLLFQPSTVKAFRQNHESLRTIRGGKRGSLRIIFPGSIISANEGFFEIS